MAVYYFAFIGVESSLRTFTSAFGVSSSLKLTRAQVAADSFSQFSAGIGSARLLLPHLCCQPCSRHPPLHLGEPLFIAGLEFVVQVAPGQVVLGSLLLVLLSSVSLSVWATHSHLVLGLAVAMAGAGVASVFASGMVGRAGPQNEKWSNRQNTWDPTGSMHKKAGEKKFDPKKVDFD